MILARLVLALLAAEPPAIIALRPAGISAYTEAVEALRDNQRVRVLSLTLPPDADAVLDAALQQRLRGAPVVVAVGQAAVDRAAAWLTPGTTLLYALAPLPPPAAPPGVALVEVDSSAAPDELFRDFLTLRKARGARIGALYSPRTEARLVQARAALQQRGVTLVLRPAQSGPEAIRALGALTREEALDGLWLGADPTLITAPVFRFALLLQFQRRLPLLALTRQQVRAGALMAVDGAPQEAGRRLAQLCSQVLEGQSQVHPGAPQREALALTPSLNEAAARRFALWPLPPGYRSE